MPVFAAGPRDQGPGAAWQICQMCGRHTIAGVRLQAAAQCKARGRACTHTESLLEVPRRLKHGDVQFAPDGMQPSTSDGGIPPLNIRQATAAGQPPPPILHFVAGRPLPLSPHRGAHVEVRLPHEELLRAARNSRKRTLWGDGVYTADSDVFSALVHQAFLPARCAELAFRWPAVVSHVRALLHVVAPPESHESTTRGAIRSRPWHGASFDCAFSIARSWLVVIPVRCCSLAPACQ